MNFDLSPEQKLIQRHRARPGARARSCRAPRRSTAATSSRSDIFARLGELGLLGMMVPEALGRRGHGRPLATRWRWRRSRARCASTAVAMSVQCSLVCAPILHDGDDAQRARWLPDLAAGRKIGCFALSEPEAGSDAKAQRTRAAQDADAAGC